MPERRLVFIILLILFLPTPPARAQAKLIPFYQKQAAVNVDYYSFQPSMLLKFSITRPFLKLPKNPVLLPGLAAWESKDVADPFVVVRADSIYLFYDGSGAQDEYRIGYAVRDPTGWFWENRRQIISGSGALWDSYHQIAPVVLPGAEHWRLYYNGNDDDEELGYQWGVAQGKPGSKWPYLKTEPIIALDPFGWDYSGSAYGDILYFPEEGIYRLWYSGFQGPLASIGLAESPDGLAWKKVGKLPVLSVLPGVIAPEVIYNGESYLMFFVQLEINKGSMRTYIRRAESADGVHWDHFQDVLEPERGWEAGRLMRPQLSYFENRMHLYYTAGGGRWRIGGAYTEPDFQPRGSWKSAVIDSPARRLQIDYEQPAGTDLQVRLIDPATGQRHPLSLTENRTELRRSVYRATAALPAAISAKARWQIEMELSTTDVHKTPVVYQILQMP